MNGDHVCFTSRELFLAPGYAVILGEGHDLKTSKPLLNVTTSRK